MKPGFTIIPPEPPQADIDQLDRFYADLVAQREAREAREALTPTPPAASPPEPTSRKRRAIAESADMPEKTAGPSGTASLAVRTLSAKNQRPTP